MKSFALTFLLTVFYTLPVTAQLSSTPDSFDTGQGELTVYPINHGSVAFTFGDQTIFADPFGGAELFERFDAPDIILITHTHGDHYNPETLDGLNTENTTFIVPQSVADQMDQSYSDQLLILGNGESSDVMNISVTAFPMYNLPGDNTVRHVKGIGNGYIVDFGGKTIYISGDTEDIPEMRALEGVDIAFVCMNLPYTMDIHQASGAVTEFRPAIVYPYHHRGQDIGEFKQLVDNAGVDVEVRLKDWYSN